ncbi:O-antigen ligase family protein [Candidatus Sumerlaeota bacterium]|nr:O-antigen ligase family protein [Candidatus Sumerlaeota bacterium]
MKELIKPQEGTAQQAMAGGMLRAAQLCVVAFVFAPLVINRRAMDDAYFMPKWVWFASWGALGMAMLAGRALLGKPIRFPFRSIWVGLIACLLLQCASLIWARSRSLAFEEIIKTTALTAGVWIALQTASSRIALLRFAWLWITIAVLTAIWTLYQDFLHAFWPNRVGIISNLPDWRGYLAAGLGNTNHIGDFLALALIPSLVLVGEARTKRALYASLAASAILPAALTVSYSVGSNAGLVLGALMMLSLTFWRERLRFFRRRGRWIALATVWGAMLAFFILDHPLNPHRPGILRQGFGSQRWAEGWPTRLVIWANGLEIVRQHPWIGVGAGNFTYVYPEMKSALLDGKPGLLVYQGKWTNAAHNIYLQSWGELGIGGLFILLAVVVFAYHSLLSEIRWCARSEFLPRMTLAGMLTAWLAHGVMNFSLQQPAGALCFYFLMFAIIAEAECRKSSPKMPAFVLDRGWFRLRIDWREMKRPLSAGLSFQLSPQTSLYSALIPFACAVALLPLLQRPISAQNEYRKARELERRGSLPEEQERHMKYALGYYPWETGCRSHYSEWLVAHGRPQDALDQLQIVRRRLNSPELWEREARALTQLGKKAEAQKAMEIYANRLWIVKHPPAQ